MTEQQNSKELVIEIRKDPLASDVIFSLFANCYQTKYFQHQRVLFNP